MPTDQPEVAGPGRGQSWVNQRRHLIISMLLEAWRRLPGLIEDKVNLGQREAGDLDIEIEIDEGLEFDREHFPVPAGIQRKLVVGDDISPALGGIEMG
jgi:hypothetical protein